MRRWIRKYPPPPSRPPNPLLSPPPTASLEIITLQTSQLHWIITLPPWVRFSIGKKRLKTETQGFQTAFVVWRTDTTRQSYERLKFAEIFNIFKNIVKNHGNPPENRGRPAGHAHTDTVPGGFYMTAYSVFLYNMDPL